MTIGDIIKNARKSKNLTQKELATKLGVSPQMISLYESNARNPKPSTLKKILKTIGLSNNEIDELLIKCTVLHNSEYANNLPVGMVISAYEKIIDDTMSEFNVKYVLYGLASLGLTTEVSNDCVIVKKIYSNTKEYKITKKEFKELGTKSLHYFKYLFDEIVSVK